MHTQYNRIAALKKSLKCVRLFEITSALAVAIPKSIIHMSMLHILMCTIIPTGAKTQLLCKSHSTNYCLLPKHFCEKKTAVLSKTTCESRLSGSFICPCTVKPTTYVLCFHPIKRQREYVCNLSTATSLLPCISFVILRAETMF